MFDGAGERANPKLQEAAGLSASSFTTKQHLDTGARQLPAAGRGIPRVTPAPQPGAGPGSATRQGRWRIVEHGPGDRGCCVGLVAFVLPARAVVGKAWTRPRLRVLAAPARGPPPKWALAQVPRRGLSRLEHCEAPGPGESACWSPSGHAAHQGCTCSGWRGGRGTEAT